MSLKGNCIAYLKDEATEGGGVWWPVSLYNPFLTQGVGQWSLHCDFPLTQAGEGGVVGGAVSHKTGESIVISWCLGLIWATWVQGL